MAAKTLSQKAIEIAVANRGNSSVSKARQLQELLQPKNSEMKIKEVKWHPRKGNW